jgi:hypothetical protein
VGVTVVLVRVMHMAIMVSVFGIIGMHLRVIMLAIVGIVVHRVYFTHLGPIAQPVRA